MIVLCATWRTARGVYDLLCEMVRHGLAVKPLLMYGASGDGDVEVRLHQLQLNLLNRSSPDHMTRRSCTATLCFIFHLYCLYCYNRTTGQRFIRSFCRTTGIVTVDVSHYCGISGSKGFSCWYLRPSISSHTLGFFITNLLVQTGLHPPAFGSNWSSCLWARWFNCHPANRRSTHWW